MFEAVEAADGGGVHGVIFGFVGFDEFDERFEISGLAVGEVSICMRRSTISIVLALWMSSRMAMGGIILTRRSKEVGRAESFFVRVFRRHTIPFPTLIGKKPRDCDPHPYPIWVRVRIAIPGLYGVEWRVFLRFVKIIVRFWGGRTLLGKRGFFDDDDGCGKLCEDAERGCVSWGCSAIYSFGLFGVFAAVAGCASGGGCDAGGFCFAAQARG